MNKKNLIAASLIFAGLTIGAQASAEIYAGAAVGKATVDLNTAGATTSNTSDTSYTLFGGYGINKNLAVEASYFSLGKATLTYPGSVTGEFSGTGVDISAVAKTDVDKGWSAFARLGVASVQGEIKGRVESFTGTASSRSTQLVAGLGVTYQYSDTVTIRGEYARRKVEVKTGGVSNDRTVPNFTIGLQFAF